MASKLATYNGALLHLEERKIASLAEAREPRRVLDDAWDSTVALCLEEGLWNFAMRVVQMDASASVDPTFGYTYAFTKPEDWVRTYRLSSAATLDPILNEFNDEAGYWYSNCDPMWAKYVSNDTAYGMDLSLWPASFAHYVEVRLAIKTCKRITSKSPSEDLLIEERKAKSSALAKDAMNEGVLFPPVGSWVRSRGGSWNSHSDGR